MRDVKKKIHLLKKSIVSWKSLNWNLSVRGKKLTVLWRKIRSISSVKMIKKTLLNQLSLQTLLIQLILLTPQTPMLRMMEQKLQK
jgi:hypothetical protein